MAPNRQDVDVILKLWELANRDEAHEARMWMYASFVAQDYADFQRRYPIGSREWRYFSSTCGMMELFGVLVTRDLVDADLFFDLFGGIEILWERVQPVLKGMRQEIDARLYENFELLVQRCRAWKAANPPKL